MLYWRPIVPGLNDSGRAHRPRLELSQHAHATVFTGLFFREEIAAYYRENGLPEPYQETARRKIMPEQSEQRILRALPPREPDLRGGRCSARPAAASPTPTAWRTTTGTTASASCATSAR